MGGPEPTRSGLVAVAVLTWVLMTPAGVSGHRDATGIVKQRMDAMTSMGGAMKELGKMIRGTQHDDAERFKAYAGTIAQHGGDELTALFPEGSLNHPTRTLPSVWADWDHFVKLAQELERTAGSLASAAPGEREALFKRLRRNCADCHRSFRTKK